MGFKQNLKFNVGKWYGVLILLVLWEILPRFVVCNISILPPISNIFKTVIENFGNYFYHSKTTFLNATIGYVLGNVMGFLLATLFIFIPKLEKISLTFFTAVFSIPIICLSPIMGQLFNAKTGNSQISLAMIAVFYPSMIYFLLGLRKLDIKILNTITIYGKSKVRAFLHIRLFAALPSILLALKISLPVAVLGSMIGELSGAKKGLGYSLFTAMYRGDSLGIWGISIYTISFVAVFYFIFHYLTIRFASFTVSESIDENRPFETFFGVINEDSKSTKINIYWDISSVIFSLILWQVISIVFNDITLKGPVDVFNFLFFKGEFPNENMINIFKALSNTLLSVVIGLFICMVCAILFSFLTIIWRFFTSLISPIILITQTIPLYSFVAIILLIFGRRENANLFIVISVTFLPAYEVICLGLKSTPPSLINLFRTYQTGSIKELALLRVPHSIPHIFSALRLILPRAFQGIIIAEYLVTGGGLGYELFAARGELNFSKVWSICWIIAIISQLLTWGLKLIEHIIHSRIKV